MMWWQILGLFWLACLVIVLIMMWRAPMCEDCG